MPVDNRMVVLTSNDDNTTAEDATALISGSDANNILIGELAINSNTGNLYAGCEVGEDASSIGGSAGKSTDTGDILGITLSSAATMQAVGTGAAPTFDDLTLSGGDINFGNGQNATLDIASTAADTAGKSMTFTAGNVLAGSGTGNTAGGGMTFSTGIGTGTAGGGDIVFKTSAAAATGNGVSGTPAAALTIDKTKTATFAGTVALGSNNLTTTGAIGTSGASITDGVTATTQNAADNSTKLATTAYVDAGASLAAQGLTVLTDVVGVSTTNDNGATWAYDNGTLGVGATLTQSAVGVVTIDGVATDTLNDRFLIKGQDDAEENGIYLVKTASAADAALVLERTLDMNQIGDTYANAFIFVAGGTSYGATSWVCTYDEAVGPTMGDDDINFAQFNAAGAFTASSGLEKDGNDVQISDAGVTLARMANLAQSTMIGRVTASTGVPQALTAANVRTIINVEDGATADQTAAEILTAIEDGVDSVHYKDGSLDNVHMANMAANTVKVRNANDAGVPSDVALTSTQILIGDGSGFTAASLSGDATMTNAGVVTVTGAGSFDLDGDIDSLTQATDWDLMDNQASALSFDTAGKAGILNIVTTNSGEKVEMSGGLDVTGTLTAGTFAPAALSATGKLSVDLAAANFAPAADGHLVHVEGGVTYTDNTTSTSGTAAQNWSGITFEAPTLAASNASVTTTRASTVYINAAPTAGTNQTLTNSYALYCAGAIGGATISGGTF